MSSCSCQRLAQRRDALVAQSIHQREQLRAQSRSVRNAVNPAQLGAGLMAQISQNKWLIAGAAVAVWLIKPRRILAGVRTGLVGLQVWRRLGPALLQLFQRN